MNIFRELNSQRAKEIVDNLLNNIDNYDDIPEFRNKNLYGYSKYCTVNTSKFYQDSTHQIIYRNFRKESERLDNHGHQIDSVCEATQIINIKGYKEAKSYSEAFLKYEIQIEKSYNCFDDKDLAKKVEDTTYQIKIIDGYDDYKIVLSRIPETNEDGDDLTALTEQLVDTIWQVIKTSSDMYKDEYKKARSRIRF